MHDGAVSFPTKKSNKKQQMHLKDSINIAYAGHKTIPEGHSSHANAHYSNANRVIETDQKSMETYCNEYLEFPRPQLMNNFASINRHHDI